MSYQLGEVWYANYPLEENNSKSIERPCIIINAEIPEVIIVKVTTKEPRSWDPFDVPIKYWPECGLKEASTARVSKVVTVDHSQILNKKGELHPEDLANVIEKLNEFVNR